jgi:hypothetical protein
MRSLVILALVTPLGLAAIAQADEPAPQPVSAVTTPVAGGNGAAAAAPAAYMVWVTGSGFYHCPADLWFGRTHDGRYMAESDALAKGYRHEKGKTCNRPV